MKCISGKDTGSRLHFSSARLDGLARNLCDCDLGTNMRRISWPILAAALSVPSAVSAADMAPQNLNAFIQQHGLGPAPLTAEEWCQLAFLAMTSPGANEQTRGDINVMARNRGCYAEARPAEGEAAKAMICRTIPGLLSEPSISSRQKLSVMDIARANKCIR
jgi:hypothetical protein